MFLTKLLGRLLAPENPAVTAHAAVLKRLDVLEEAVGELADGQEDVINKVRSWSAREAAKRRHEASRNMSELMEGGSEAEGENVDSGASSADDIAMRRMADQRAAAKAAVARQFRGTR